MIQPMSDPKMIFLMLTLLLLPFAGCNPMQHGMEQATTGGQRLERAERMTYPDDMEIGESLRIEVIRNGRSIVLDNRSVESYENVVLWLNQEYGATIPMIEIGRNQPIALSHFVNWFGDTYPLARFLNPDRDKTLITAEIQLQGKLRKLTVRLEEGWDRP